MIELKNDRLVFSFPEVHPEAKCSIEFQRTLRIPDDNREYNLPPGFGCFPLFHVDDYKDTVPETWLARGGVFLPMYQAEAMWIYLHGSYPMAIKVAAGKIDAVTGEDWKNKLTRKPQDYLVVPDQPWLDGFNVDEGLIRQFVAMPLGEGYTAEEQLTGEAEHGGVQIIAFPMKRTEYDKLSHEDIYLTDSAPIDMCVGEADMEMGLAPGGLMRQEIFEDTYGFNVWERDVSSRCYVHIANSVQYFGLTGEEPPTQLPDAQSYTNAGLPWFKYYDSDQTALEGAKKLANLDSVAAKKVKKGKGVLKGNDPVKPKVVKKLRKRKLVREGEF
ncbi:hypothetical protein MUP29_06470 [bacterium]|nr:hypothetical protein [bacterium]